ncbi:MAG: class I SAM-dependent methyltransferase [Promethearchaeia archaeon]
MNDEYSFDVKRERPEEKFDSVFDYFKDKTLEDYAYSKNMQRIQTKITIRALEILNLKSTNALILDAGCGPGFASFYLKELGFKIVAFDIISEFLYVHNLQDLNPIVADMSYPPFKPEQFDAILSISALQWVYRGLFDKKTEKNFVNLIKSFYEILKLGSKIVFQFYPKNDTILKRINSIIIQETEFEGGFIIDNPDTPKKRRIFLELIKEI